MCALAEKRFIKNEIRDEILEAVGAIVSEAAPISTALQTVQWEEKEWEEKIEEASKIAMTTEYQVTRAKVFGRENKFHLVLDAAEDILSVVPLHYQAVNFKAYALMRLGKLEESLSFVKECIQKAHVLPGYHTASSPLLLRAPLH